jgi:hypothetical protein
MYAQDDVAFMRRSKMGGIFLQAAMKQNMGEILQTQENVQQEH